MSAVAVSQDSDAVASHSKVLAETSPLDLESKAEETPDPRGIQELSISPSSNKENDSESGNKHKEEMDVETKTAEQDVDGEEEEEEEGSGSESEEESSSEESDDLYDGLSKEDIARLKSAMAGIQNDYEDHCVHEKKEMIKETQDVIQFNLAILVSDEEAAFIGNFVKENNINLVQYLEDEGIQFLAQMKEMMDQCNSGQNTHSNKSGGDEEEEDYEFPDSDDGDEDWVQHEKSKKAKRAAKRKAAGSNQNNDGSKRCGRLLLNDALKNVGSMEGWSEARKKAWTNRRTSPNAYFYRFNVPGQPQKNGKWNKADHALFMKRIMEVGANDSWGIFSKKIPGRVGYQCSNYWRGLVKDGDVVDPNYHYDGKKLHFKRNPKKFRISDEYRRFAITIVKDYSKVWTDLPAKHPKHPSDAYCREVDDALSGVAYGKAGAGKGKKKRKRGNAANDSDEDWDSKPATKRRRRNRKRYTDEDGDEAFHCSVTAPEAVPDDDNPMPDFVDIMTGAPVSKPTISPYGHVLGYETWTMLLRTSKAKNLCPFTMQKLTRRSLIKLTKDNYDEYKDQVRNVTDEQKALMSTINS